MVKIIKTRGSHLKRFVELGKKQWPSEKWITLQYMKNTLRMKGLHFTALANGQIVGGIMVEEQDGPRSWIYYFCVADHCRRQGIGTALLKKVELKLKKGTLLFVDLEKNDKTGLRFYKKNGFHNMGAVNNWFEGDRKGIILAKEIR